MGGPSADDGPPLIFPPSPMRSSSFLILMNLALLFCGCKCTAKDIRALQPGVYYSASYSGADYFFQIDSLSENRMEGGLYRVEGAVAARHPFSAQLRRRRLSLNLEGAGETIIKLRKLTLNDYVEPEFVLADTRLFQEPLCGVSVARDVVYGNAPGYWTSLPGVEAEISKAITDGYLKSFKKRDLDLTLDLYRPEGVGEKRPLILFIHGGAFYIGDKQEPAYVDFCSHFASMGYVTASMNYRMGFHLGKGELERAEYAALQDAAAALRFLVAHADEYGIDADRIFLAGSSAGSITALNAAFATDRDRPKASFGDGGLIKRDDMGPIQSSGNHLRTGYSIMAVANMWGAVSSKEMLRNSRTDIVSFHGEDDHVVPFGEGYPFSDVNEIITKLLAEPMYGSACIDSTAAQLGLRTRLYPFPGQGHAFNVSGPEKKPNDFHLVIRGRIGHFFYEEMVPSEALVETSGDGTYSILGNVESVCWKAEGGFILETGARSVRVLWREDATDRSVTASGTYPGGPGFVVRY